MSFDPVLNPIPMNFTYYGHSCFAVEVGGRVLLFDPFITPNPQAAGIDIKLVRADYILVSHGHQDHLADAVVVAKRTGATVIANYEWRRGWKTWRPKNPCAQPRGRVRFLGPGPAEDGQCHHSRSLPDWEYGGNPGGFVVENCARQFLLFRRHGADAGHEADRGIHAADICGAVHGGNYTMGTRRDAVRRRGW